MASSNAGPITGSELLRGIQGETEVLFTRPQVAALLVKTAILRPRVYATPTAFTGGETFLALQKGSAIRLSAADLTTYLAGAAAPDAFPDHYAVIALSGAELLLGVQDVSLIALSCAEVGMVRTAGGTPTPTPTPTPAPTPTAFLGSNTQTWGDNTKLVFGKAA